MPFRKLKEHEVQSTESLIAAIERKDRRFRFFQTVFMVGTFVALILIIGAQQRVLDGVGQQLTEARKTAAQQDKKSNESDAKIERRLDCMVVFFSQIDRTNLSIANIDKCTLNRNGDIQQFFRDEPEGGTTTTPTEQTPSLTPSTTAPNSSAPNQPAEEEQAVVEPRPPVTAQLPLLPAIPLCVPLLEICVR